MQNDADSDRRRDRLRTMQQRYGQAPATPSFQEAPAPAAAVAQNNGLLPRLIVMLTQSGPGAKLIPGTSIREDRMKQVMQVLQQRAQQTGGSRGQRLQRLVAYLSQAEPGDAVIAGVNVKRLQQLIDRFVQNQSALVIAPVAAERVSPLPAATVSEPVTASPAVTAASTLPEIVVLQTAVQQLNGRVQQLTQQLDDVKRQLSQLTAAAPQPAAPLPSSPATDKPLPSENWFMDFLE